LGLGIGVGLGLGLGIGVWLEQRGDVLRPQQRGIEGEAGRLVRVRVSGRVRV